MSPQRRVTSSLEEATMIGLSAFPVPSASFPFAGHRRDCFCYFRALLLIGLPRPVEIALAYCAAV
jgi:hypothetical protein